jgi:hypothetical protein
VGEIAVKKKRKKNGQSDRKFKIQKMDNPYYSKNGDTYISLLRNKKSTASDVG